MDLPPASHFSRPFLGTIKRSLRIAVVLTTLAMQGGLLAQAKYTAMNGRPVHKLQSYTGKPSDNWVVALDEIAWSDRNQQARIERIEEQPSLEALGSWLKTTAQLNGLKPSLVLYDTSRGNSSPGPALATREVVVTLGQYVSPQSIALALGAEYKGELEYAPGAHRFLAATTMEALTAAATLAKHPGVVAVYPQIARRREFTSVPNDTFYKEQWHLKNTGQTGAASGLDLNVEPAWETVRGRGVVIGIIDSGLSVGHADLAGNVFMELGYDFRDGDDDPSPFLGTPNQQDPQNKPFEDDHGTLVAGIAAGRGFNGIGITGVAPEAGIADIRLIGDYLTDVQEADAIHHRNDVIAIKNNSWGPRDNGAVLSGPDVLAKAALFDAITHGRDGLGTIFVWSGGNGGRNDDNSNKNGFANSIYTIAVGALNDLGTRAEYSEIGSNLLVTAPVGGRRGFGAVTADLAGDDGLNFEDYIYDLDDPAYTQNFFGTSASAPMVSGVIALMLEANPNLGWRDVQEILVQSSQKIDESSTSWKSNFAGLSFSDEYGAGLIDATAAVNLSKSWINLGPQLAASRNLQIDEPIPIPDAGGGPVESSFPFSGISMRVEHATVSVFIDHPARGEIAVELESPSGMISQLVGRNDDDSRGYFDWTFSSVQFWGENSDGTWKLRIEDGVAGNTGELFQATVTLHGTIDPSENLPAPPINLVATGIRSGGIALDWEDEAGNESGYRIEVSPGYGAPWVEDTVLPPNTTHYELDFLPQGVDIYFRVTALNGGKQSGYSNIAHAYTQDGNGAILLQTGFEVNEGFSANNSVSGTNGWIAFPESFTFPAQGVSPDFFSSLGRPGHGQQAFVGKSWRGGSEVSSILQPTFLEPPPNTSIRFITLVSITNSTHGGRDGFGFNFFNQDGFFLCNVVFDNTNGAILYASQATNNFQESQATFQRNIVYELEITLNFGTDLWSAKLGTQTIVSNARILGSGSGIDANLGSFEAFWQVLNTSTPGNNAMYFDDMRITQIGTAPPDTPSEFTVQSFGSSITFLSWTEDLMAEQYEIQRSPDGTNNWNTIATVSEDLSFYIDAFLEPNTVYFYRIRALSSVGNSAYFSPASARTFTEYEDWKYARRFEIDTPDDQDGDLDNIPLLMEYALKLNPREGSNRGLPRAVVIDGKAGLRFLRARKELVYRVEGSLDLNSWTSEGINQEADVLGLYITGAFETDDLGPRFLRLVVSE